MTVITDITIPADQFALGRLFDSYPDIEIELERLVPLRAGIIPLFWVEGAERNEIEATIASDEVVKKVTHLTEVDERHLFEIVWSPDINALVQPMIESDAEILKASGTVTNWEFRLQFVDRETLADFRERCQENGVRIHLDALYNPAVPFGDGEGGLTVEQYDIIATAHENDFWKVPRGITVGELADLIGISSNAASQRMRRGLGRIVSDHLREIRQSDRDYINGV